jgi:signal transduction histidine kinase/ligand-binding sensor domain-containing protein
MSTHPLWLDFLGRTRRFYGVLCSCICFVRSTGEATPTGDWHAGTRIPRSILQCLSLLLVAGSSWAVDPSRHISQYAHTAWRVQDGIFTGAPSAITQTADGYLWVGTENGILRFDGVRFTPWSTSHGSKLPSSAILDLVGAQDGSLWIATVAGLSRWHDGVLTNFVHDPSTFEPLVESRDGSIWVIREERVGTQIARVCRVTGSGFQCRGGSEAIPPGVYKAIAAEDTSGALWMGSQTALVNWKPQLGSSNVYTPPALSAHAGVGISAIAVNPDGSLWVGMALRGRGLGLQRFVHGAWKPFVVRGFDSSTLEVQTVSLDRNNTLWIGTVDQGIYRISGGQVDHFGSADGLSSDSVLRFSEDREGNLWVTTSRGIDCFHDVRVASFSKREGLTVTEVDAVLAARDGSLWVAGADALNVFHHDRVTSIHAPEGVPGNQYTSLFEDHLGQIWIGIDNTLWIYTKGAFHRVTRQGGQQTGVIADIAEDVDGNIWAESLGPPRALLRIHGLRVEEEFPASLIPAAHTIAADRESGIWLGLLDGDLARYRHGSLETFHFEHTLPSRLLQISVDTDGSVLGATHVGLIGWRKGTQRTLTTKNGLPCDAVFSFVRDGHGALWLYTQCGLVEIAATALQVWWEHPDAQIPLRIFDVFDGVQPEGAPFRSAARSPDGRLWFVNLSLLQMIDPAHLDGNVIMPPVYIEQIIADRRSYLIKEGLRLPALTRNLEIDYTALSFMAPQKMRFRYRLEGRDAAWQDSGTRRQAFYTDLRPGNYRFRVIASNNDGVWNTEGATLSFSVAPAWYQTNWFFLLGFAIAASLATALYRWRMRQVFRAISARFDERLAERTRLARELHDTLLQTVQGSKMVADDALDEPQNPERVRHALERVSTWLGRAIDEGRAALNSLRTSTTERNDLAASLRRATQECRMRNPMQVEFSVIGTPRDMHPIVRDELYRIGYEAIRNACAHSTGSRLEVTLQYAQDLSLRVRDNGVGIDQHVLDQGRSGHFGLQGMRERAARIGGRLTVLTSADSGTEVNVVVPGNII